MSAQQTATLDVSHLPTGGFDTKAPLWWGNLLLLAIETTTLVIAAAAYFYLVQNFNIWPPPRRLPPVELNAEPDILLPTINTVIILLGCIPMIFTDRAARSGDKGSVKIGLMICLLIGLVTIGLRSLEFPAVKFQYNTNAYGSAVWAILILHMLHLIVETLEVIILSVYVFNRKLDEHHRMDITVTAVYWYWVALIWIPLYAIVYLGPRFH